MAASGGNGNGNGNGNANADADADADADASADACNLAALAAGDFAQAARRLRAGGLQVELPAAGMLRVACGNGGPAAPLRLLLSIGVHGNETAPIEMMAPVLEALCQAPRSLAVDLLLVVGNPDAIAVGARFIDADLNRLFTPDRGALAGAAEAARADLIMQASAAFFASPSTPRMHLDLHSAIRPSRYPRFAVIPAAVHDAAQLPLTRWLGSAAIEAVMFNSQRASTYSAYTARSFGALSCTVELGQVGVLGQHPPQQLRETQAAITRLLRGEADTGGGAAPVRFRVAQEIIKRSDDFEMAFDDSTHNFAAMAPGSVIAIDDGIELLVGPATEYVVFPNPRVLVGQRAGLMVVRDDDAAVGPADRADGG